MLNRKKFPLGPGKLIQKHRQKTIHEISSFKIRLMATFRKANELCSPTLQKTPPRESFSFDTKRDTKFLQDGLHTADLDSIQDSSSAYE